jgi:hypothetical protein
MAKTDSTIESSEFHGDSTQVLSALSEILASATFWNADRLKSFLEYVVLETVHGRGDGIRGKTIAQDVYGRRAETDGDPENVVRVDARRLRRRLAEYYEDEGRDAKVRIHIDSGGYTPRFETVSDAALVETDDPSPAPDPTLPDQPQRHRALPYWVAGAALIMLTAFGATFFIYGFHTHSSEISASSGRLVERQAILEKSPAALQAVNMAEQARDLIFPIFDVERQRLSLGFFKEAIRLDPDYAGGYAGAAQTTGTLALLSPAGDQKETLKTQARSYAEKAVALDPTDPWSQSAASWAAMANGDYAEASRLSARANAMAPADLHILEIYGTVALANGDFQLALDLSRPLIEAQEKLHRTANRNVYAVANFFLGNYAETLQALQIAAEQGEPVSSGMLAFKIAAHQALGHTETAQRHAKILMDTWPIPIDEVIARIMRDPAHPDRVAGYLKQAGWSPPD